MDQSLFEALEGEQDWISETFVNVAQRGGRAGRKAYVKIKSCSFSVRPPCRSAKQAAPLEMNAVAVRELGHGEHVPLNWTLLTSEPIHTEEQARQIVRFYELRWRIEEYHKAWKSGVGAERLRMQSKDSLLRMLVITSFVAARLLQLREIISQKGGMADQETPCDRVLERDEWIVLWLWLNKIKPPAEPPPLTWAAQTIAKLGGFTDSKRTGKPGWMTMWKGWEILQERVAGFRTARQLEKM